jgi:hypothetical protein
MSHPKLYSFRLLILLVFSGLNVIAVRFRPTDKGDGFTYDHPIIVENMQMILNDGKCNIMYRFKEIWEKFGGNEAKFDLRRLAFHENLSRNQTQEWGIDYDLLKEVDNYTVLAKADLTKTISRVALQKRGY